MFIFQLGFSCVPNPGALKFINIKYDTACQHQIGCFTSEKNRNSLTRLCDKRVNHVLAPSLSQTEIMKMTVNGYLLMIRPLSSKL